LAQTGQRVCILERGRRYLASDLPVLPESEFAGVPNERAAPGADRVLPDFSRALWQMGQGLWEVRDLGELVVNQAAGYGGGSLIYANVQLRPPRKVFERWPHPYQTDSASGNRAGAVAGPLDPYFELAAYMLQVEALPDDVPRKTLRFEQAAEELGHPTFRPPLAVNFGQPRENPFGVKQGACNLRAECAFGCRRQAKNTLDLNYLHVAEEQGAEVRTLAEVVHLSHRAGGGYLVEYRDHLAGRRCVTIAADYVFLCAGAVNTTELLLRNRGALDIQGEGLGSGFFPNSDDLVVAFDCDEVQQLDRGPTITSSLLYDDGESFFLVQDGGFPTHLEPWLGLYRSPLWLHRNGFARPSARNGSGASQRTPYAPLPFESLVDGFSTFTGGAITGALPIFNDISQTFLAFARGGRDLERWHSDHADDLRVWSLLPDALRAAAMELRNRSLDQIALGAEPVLDGLIEDTAKRIAPDIARLIDAFGDQIEIPDLEPSRIAEWGMRLAVQSTWGSQAGLLGALAENLRTFVLPTLGDLPGRVAAVLRWALDYRLGDGHTALLLSMGLDTKEPWRLALDQPAAPDPGDRVEGRGSGGAGFVVGSSESMLVLAGVTGEFEAGERLVAGSRTFGVAETGVLEDLDISVGLGGEPGSAAAAPFSVRALRYQPVSYLEDYSGGESARRRVEPDGSERTADEPREPGGEPNLVKRELPLVARLEHGPAREERVKQELLLRDISAELGGEMRADPVEAFLDRRVTVHAQGGCPMAESSSRGVTDPDGEIFGCPGLYVMDGASFPGPVGVNPSATIMAVAEYKVERFVQHVLERRTLPGPWTEHRRRAGEWAKSRKAFLDPIGRLTPGAKSPALRSRTAGIEFEEVMKGSLRAPVGDEREHPVTLELQVTVPDLRHFLDENSRGRPVRMEARGQLTILGVPGLPEDPLEVAAGSHLELRKPRSPSGVERRELEYRLDLRGNGRPYSLIGTKHIRDDEHFDVWEDTTTLFFDLMADGETLGGGVLRVPAAEFFGSQLRSIKATGVEGDPARQVWAIASFGKFFFGHLVDVYVPGFKRIVEVARSVAEKGHV
jgi:choline dehydrogenase-like flavoprotein